MAIIIPFEKASSVVAGQLFYSTATRMSLSISNWAASGFTGEASWSIVFHRSVPHPSAESLFVLAITLHEPH
jgi:hypothetical protein